ncbi:MAG: hypothetical protein P1P77_06485 [Spirochaetaceae bacterium]|nr:hypothetical protein [Spirochaetaceae bacterium]
MSNEIIYKKTFLLRNSILTILFLFILISIPVSLSAESRLFLLRGQTLYILDGVNGEMLDKRNFSARELPDILLGTPGGKYVFVVDSASGIGEAVDFEDAGQAKALDLSEFAPIAGMAFSPMGDRFYVWNARSGDVRSYGHRAGQLTGGEDLALPDSGSPDSSGIALNSRGTRIYRSVPGALAYYLSADLSLLKTVELDGGSRNWLMAPGGRRLWGTGGAGWTVVDEARGVPVADFPAEEALPPVFDAAGRTAWALAESGTLLLEFDVRRTREVKRERLPEPVVGPTPGAEGGVWLAGEDRLYRFDDELVNIAPLPGSGKVKALMTVELKPGQGFACF